MLTSAAHIYVHGGYVSHKVFQPIFQIFSLSDLSRSNIICDIDDELIVPSRERPPSRYKVSPSLSSLIQEDLTCFSYPEVPHMDVMDRRLSSALYYIAVRFWLAFRQRGSIPRICSTRRFDTCR